MLNGSIVRCLFIVAFTYAIHASLPYEGMPWWFDGSLGLIVKEYPTARRLVWFMGGLTLFAELAGAFLPAPTMRIQRRVVATLVITLLSIVVLWQLRVANWLGDLHGVDRGIFPPIMVETAEPLGSTTSYFTMWLATQLGFKWSTFLQLASVLFGAFAIGAMFLWAELLTAEWVLLFLMMISTGVMVLFCGYPEKGTPKAIAFVCWYLYAGTRALREPQKWWDVVASAVLALAGLMHGSAACLLPAHVLCIWWPRRWWRALLGFSVFSGLIALMIASVYFGWLTVQRPLDGNTTAPIFWLKKYCITNCGYDFFSFRHFDDILNCILILAPFAALSFPEAIYRTRTTVEEWLLVGTLGGLFLSIIWFPVFGYRGDWDIFVITPLVMSYFTAQVAVRVLPPQSFRRYALAWIACSSVHTVSWWLFFSTPM